MISLTRTEGHLIVAAIRVLDHRDECPPSPAGIANLLELAESAVRLQLNALAEMGIVLQVESAYENHFEVKNYSFLEDLDQEEGPGITQELADFDREKEEEAERMANLFTSGEHERVRGEKQDRMDQDFKDFKKKKNINPFGDD